MKKILLGVLLGLSISSLLAFKVLTYEPKKSTADADQIEGKYIFIKSKPAMEYEVLGSEKTSVTWSGKPTELLNIALKKGRNDFPQAEGIIFTNETLDRYEFIKFKN